MITFVVTVRITQVHSPVILWKKRGQLKTNCNTNGFHSFYVAQKNMSYNISKVPGNPSGGK